MTTLVWCQRELRLNHNLALQKALKSPGLVIFAYFFDPKLCIGGLESANTAWLAKGLLNLQETVQNQGGSLWLIDGDFQTQFADLLINHNIQEVIYSFQVGEPFATQQRLALGTCQKLKVKLSPLYSEFLLEPEQMTNQQGRPYLVFTPFYKSLSSKAQTIETIDNPPLDLQRTAAIPQPDNCKNLPKPLFDLLAKPWAAKTLSHWQIGEEAAWQRLEDFLANAIENYEQQRDYPASSQATSQLSPYLHFGQISIRAIYELLQIRQASGSLSTQANQWLRQLVWKEFARHLLYWFPLTETQPFQEKYKLMTWTTANHETAAWQQGQTGFPIIDAGMRELWATGTMHNRVRMLVASFLTKNLNQHWLTGKTWFDNTLLDADPANNIMGWQWVAGCGVDASPYYRLFNPVLQSEKFDSKGEYIRQWIPEISTLSMKAIHAPWLFEPECRAKNIQLGTTYPKPLVDLKISREAHLERVHQLKLRQPTSTERV